MDNKTATQTDLPSARVHAWEQASLGKAPYRCTHSTRTVWRACPGAPLQTGACCDYCGTGIMRAYWILSADGKKFKVGSSCVEKTNSKGDRVRGEVDRLRRKAQREQRHEREAVRDARTRAQLADDNVRTKLVGVPHPNAFRAEKGGTLLDWCEWMMDCAGAAGRGRVAKAIAAFGEEGL